MWVELYRYGLKELGSHGGRCPDAVGCKMKDFLVEFELSKGAMGDAVDEDPWIVDPKTRTGKSMHTMARIKILIDAGK